MRSSRRRRYRRPGPDTAAAKRAGTVTGPDKGTPTEITPRTLPTTVRDERLG